MEDYIEKFEALENTINDTIIEEDIDLLLGDGIHVEYIEKSEAEFNIKLPKDIKDYYYYFNHQRIIWSKETIIDGRNMLLKGQFETIDIEDMLSKKAYFKNEKGEEDLDYFWSETLDTEIIDSLKDYYPFDNLGLGYFTLIKLEKETYSFYLFQPNGEITHLDLSLHQYLDHVLNNHGLHLWTQFIKENKSTNDLPFYNELFIKQLVSINENIDLSTYKKSGKPITFETKDYIDQLEELQDDLVNNEFIMIPNFSKNPPVGLQALLKAEQVISFPFPKELKEFYLEMNGFEFAYFFDDDDEYLEGNSRILKLEELMGGLHGAERRTWGEESGKDLVWQSNLLKEDPAWVEKMKSYKVVEYITPTLFTCIQFDKENSDYNLYLCQYDDPMRFKLRFSEFIETLIKTKGMLHWQYYYTFEEDFPSLESLNNIKEQHLTIFEEELTLKIALRNE
ncbi:hypothetical protein H2O64_22135 [Kordia sp. YSTF-M3]|uniref:Knr4/Smi1-like domain-containing protein n=1 Tax=Kordia aestuariivivens TaxID=2759037 RepID=A0ABR7QFM7_9FLAO|nr:hypothetical protein [Kordia aestuariivivens]MBC8757385.1 hypothetical protein [Kordia aestuariivivens]